MVEKVIGWLDREGNFFECEEYEHNDEATILQEKFNLKPIYKDGFVLFGTSLLEHLGWISITQSKYYGRVNNYPDRGFIGYENEKPFSKKQIDWFNKNRERLSPKQREHLDDFLEFARVK